MSKRVLLVFIALILISLVMGCRDSGLVAEDINPEETVQVEEKLPDKMPVQVEEKEEVNNNPDNDKLEITSSTDIPYVTAIELTVNGVSGSTTVDELIKLLGTPNEIMQVSGASETSVYKYKDVEYVVENQRVSFINIVGITGRTPRDIQVGDSFQDVIIKFPQERNYLENKYGSFYGEIPEHMGKSFGYVSFSGDYGSPSIIIASESVVPFFKIHFENDKVVWMQIFYWID